MYNKDDFNNIDSDKDIYSSSGRDISSHSYTDISSRSAHFDNEADYNIPVRKYQPRQDRYETQPQRQTAQKTDSRKPKKRKKHFFLRFVAVLLCFSIVFCAGLYGYAYSIIDKIKRTPLDTADLGITTSNYSGYKSIALLGLDTREDDKSGRSDANVVVTIDKANKKIKLTSIARDSYVTIEGHSKDKLTHAYAYGKSQLTVKTLNQNFGLEITDYVTMNFFELAHIINYLGGVEIDVDEVELEELNYIIRKTDFGDIDSPRVAAPGVQILTGTQAVCYARIRKTDSDVERGNRQKEVLSAMFAAAKKMNPLKLPKLASLILEECETSLSTNDIINLGLWAVIASPEFEQLSIPNDNVKGSGRMISGVWYYVYDTDKARQEISDFIFEENYYSPQEVAKRKQEAEE